MRKVGNVVSNQIYNPENKRPPVPVDVDEADSAMERFIRQKYMNNVVNGGKKASSPHVDEGVPPPLPPKNSSKFGLRSAASLFPLSSRSKKEAKPTLSADARRPSSGGKVSRVFGASANFDDGDDTEKKLARLQDMGFSDNQRNAIVLKGVNGNMDKAIESLVRLGGEGRMSPIPPPPPPHDPPSLRATRSLTPLSSNSGSAGAAIFGLSTAPKPTSTNSEDQAATPSRTSTNPFDMMPTQAQPQTAHSTGSLHNNNPYNQSTNPFGAPAPQQPDAFAQAFQQLDISSAQQAQQAQQTQPLFPNRTGGLTPQIPTPSSFSQPPAPSAPSSPSVQQMPFQNMTYPQPMGLQQQQTGYNPFFQNAPNQYQYQYQHQHQHQQPVQLSNQHPYQQQPQPQQQNIHISTQQPPAVANNPFARSPTRIGSPTPLGQIPEQSQSSFQGQYIVQQPQPGANNPFFTSPMQTPQQYGHQGYFQAPPRHDKASIMALYGAAPANLERSASADVPASVSAQDMSNSFDYQTPAQQAQTQAPPQPQRSLTQPVPQANTNNNPFMNGVGNPTAAGPSPTQRQISRESVILGKDMAWANGRHSPDAFASLSARHG